MNARAFALAVIVLAAGCHTAGSATPDSRDGALAGTTWGVEQIDDVAANDAATTLRFVGDSRVSGRAACNQYAGALQLGAGTMRNTETRSTRMACAAAVMEQESRFLAALGAVRAFRRDGDRLLLLDDTGRVRIRLVPRP